MRFVSLSQPVQFDRVLAKHHPCEFIRPGRRNLAVIHHAHERQAERLPSSCDAQPSQFFP